MEQKIYILIEKAIDKNGILWGIYENQNCYKARPFNGQDTLSTDICGSVGSKQEALAMYDLQKVPA